MHALFLIKVVLKKSLLNDIFIAYDRIGLRIVILSYIYNRGGQTSKRVV